MVMNYHDDEIWLSPVNNLIEKYMNFKNDGPNLEQSQTGLIDKIIKYARMSQAAEKSSPAVPKPLGTNKPGYTFKKSWNYSAVVGMSYVSFSFHTS